MDSTLSRLFLSSGVNLGLGNLPYKRLKLIQIKYTEVSRAINGIENIDKFQRKTNTSPRRWGLD